MTTTKDISRYTLLRRVCTSSEKKALTKVKKDADRSWFEDSLVPADTKPRYILSTLFIWGRTPQGWDYWKHLGDKLEYLEKSKGW